MLLLTAVVLVSALCRVVHSSLPLSLLQVPYGCLVPDVNNLLVAGRCVGGDM